MTDAPGWPSSKFAQMSLELLRLKSEGITLKVAIQFFEASSITWPSEQSAFPDQPLNVEPEAGEAISVTEVPGLHCSEQILPQLMPEGLLVTVPEPVPFLETESV
jgi:hypothetical protein